MMKISNAIGCIKVWGCFLGFLLLKCWLLNTDIYETMLLVHVSEEVGSFYKLNSFSSSFDDENKIGAKNVQSLTDTLFFFRFNE